MQKKPVSIVILAASIYLVVIAMKKTILTDKAEEIDYLARTIWGEARGEGNSGMQAVANVIMNRVKAATWYGAGVKDVVLKKSQFSCWNDGDPNKAKMLAVTDSDISFRNAKYLAEQAVNGVLPDITGGANHYHASNIRPYWADTDKMTVIIGNHVFYKL